MSTMTIATAHPADVDELVLELLELGVDQLGRPCRPGLERAKLRAGIPAWHPRNDEDDGDADGDADGDKGGKGDEDEDDDDAGDKGDKDDDEDDDDEGESEADKARRATAAANRRVRELERQRDEEATKAAEKAGKWEDLAKQRADRIAELEAEVVDLKAGALAKDALTALGCKNPARAVKLMDLEDVEDEDSAEAAAKRLKRSDSYLFEKKATRQRRGRASNGEDDDEKGDDRNDEDDDDRSRGRRNGSPKKVGVARMRDGYGKTPAK